jgi:hypothetical protein
MGLGKSYLKIFTKGLQLIGLNTPQRDISALRDRRIFRIFVAGQTADGCGSAVLYRSEGAQDGR